jgi:ubiquinone/menaquinone biosynthesis C-methylase UbiE
MTETANIDRNEQHASEAFSAQAVIFDDIYAGDTIIKYKRERVRNHVINLLSPGSLILELNSGTGDDALFFAQQGHTVHATDVSAGMQAELKHKVKLSGLENRITAELCSYTQLEQLQNKGPYDHIFSNFAGLNCTNELEKVLVSFDVLLNPGGSVTLVILPKFCLWETLLLFKGKFRTAFRRLFSSNGASAHIQGVYFKCWYYNPSFIINRLKDKFNLAGIEGLCTMVPPSYMEGFAEKHPAVYAYLKNKEDKFKGSWPWKYIGDYYIISLKKK